MKKIYFLSAALFAATFSLGLTSCSVEDDEEIVLDSTVKSTVVDDVMSKSTDNVIPAAKQAPIEIKLASGAPISKIIIGSNAKAILYKSNAQAARAIVDGSNVYTGTYTITADGFVIACPELGADILVPADLVSDIHIGDDAYAIASATEVPTSATATDLSICRTWSNPTYAAGVYFDKLPVYGVKAEDKAGVKSIKDLANAVVNRILAEDSSLRNEGFDILSSDIESLTFTADKVYLRFENGRVEESTWAWNDKSKGQLKTVVDGKDVTLDARFESGTPNKAYFIIDANCEGVGGLGVHTLSGRLICTMTD